MGDSVALGAWDVAGNTSAHSCAHGVGGGAGVVLLCCTILRFAGARMRDALIDLLDLGVR